MALRTRFTKDALPYTRFSKGRVCCSASYSSISFSLRIFYYRVCSTVNINLHSQWETRWRILQELLCRISRPSFFFYVVIRTRDTRMYLCPLREDNAAYFKPCHCHLTSQFPEDIATLRKKGKQQQARVSFLSGRKSLRITLFRSDICSVIVDGI